VTSLPLFLLRMEKEFGSDRFRSPRYAAGQPITTDRFSEFEVLGVSSNKAYEDLERALAVGEKNLVFTEVKQIFCTYGLP